MTDQSSTGTDRDIAQAIAGPVRTMQVVTFALAQGAIVIWALFLFLQEGATDGEPDILSWLAIGVAGAMLVMHLVLPSIIQNSALANLKTDAFRASSFEEKAVQVVATFQTRQIAACAMLEGAAVLNAVAYLLSNWLGNVIAGAVMIVLILSRMPLPSSLAFKVQDKLRELENG